ncbi:unnamed protein product [Trichogramma brassicae]|uniref:C2H2-type domain-containing protein n=1 Tax=Trichogramma brassicae TaxID=86971 RepID=A0A6H5J240_9HYME|nr:unnamed protein product [Trichogramma brassicae]
MESSEFFGCAVRCGKAFTSNAYLKCHTASVHNGNIPTCDICGKSFVCKGSLKKHIHKQHSGAIHTCKVCGKKCTRKSSLK